MKEGKLIDPRLLPQTPQSPRENYNPFQEKPEKTQSEQEPTQLKEKKLKPKDEDLSHQKARETLYYSAGCFWSLGKWIIVVVILVILVHLFVVTPMGVSGASMEPNFHTGQYILVNRWQYLFGQPERGDPVVLKFPGDPEHKKYIKRLIGLPGENVSIANGHVYINGLLLREPYLSTSLLTYPDLNIMLSSEDYFLLGDNRNNSNDSRNWGTAPKRDLIGRAWVIFWPHLENIPTWKYK